MHGDYLVRDRDSLYGHLGARGLDWRWSGCSDNTNPARYTRIYYPPSGSPLNVALIVHRKPDTGERILRVKNEKYRSLVEGHPSVEPLG